MLSLYAHLLALRLMEGADPSTFVFFVGRERLQEGILYLCLAIVVDDNLTKSLNLHVGRHSGCRTASASQDTGSSYWWCGDSKPEAHRVFLAVCVWHWPHNSESHPGRDGMYDRHSLDLGMSANISSSQCHNLFTTSGAVHSQRPLSLCHRVLRTSAQGSCRRKSSQRFVTRWTSTQLRET